VTVTATNNFTGNVGLTCNVTPAQASPPSCTIKPANLGITTNGSAQAALSIKTSKATQNTALPPGLWLPITGLAFMGTGLAGLKRRRRFFFLGGCLILTALLLMPACTSSSNGGGGGGGGATTPGTYNVTVTGTALGASTTSASQSFTVN
jgi:hypothetical protein